MAKTKTSATNATKSADEQTDSRPRRLVVFAYPPYLLRLRHRHRIPPATGEVRAIIIDFDLAERKDPIDLVNTSSLPGINYSSGLIRICQGTKLYMPTMVLKSEDDLSGDVLPFHDHLDDLESSSRVLIDIYPSLQGFDQCLTMHSDIKEWLTQNDRMPSGDWGIAFQFEGHA
ncbi:hypothetical protein V5O48_008675 [Marasmius crinis-equi]|uniref:Uncharacterized protein n=1 Tax=Marasmius crinis-equi TaxID=585013 RepID=A0ABR3FDB6_9AGAR